MMPMLLNSQDKNPLSAAILRRVHGHRMCFNIIVVGPMQSRKCQPKGSKVLMADGEWKNIEEIKIGDEVLSPQEDGSYLFAHVNGTCQYESNDNYDILELWKKRRKLYSCSGNHIIPVNHCFSPRENLKYCNDRINKWGRRHIEAHEFAERPKSFKQNHTAFTSPLIPFFKGRTNCSIEPYSLGVWLGDGSFVESNLSITNMNEDIINEVSKYYPPARIHVKKDNKAKMYAYHMGDQLAIELRRVGLYEKRSGDKFIPTEALLSDVIYRKRLLAGLIDTDGYLSHAKSYYITTKSKQLADDVAFLVASLGGRSSIRKEIKTIKRIGFIGEYFTVCFYIGDMELPLKVPHKIKRYVFTARYANPNWIGIDAVRAPSCIVHGIEIDTPSKWYITDNMMVTHNSTGCVTLCKQLNAGFDLERDMAVISGQKLQEILRANHKRGDVIMADDFGIGLNHRQWFSFINKALNFAMQTHGYKGLIIILTVPYENFIDKDTRLLFNLELTTVAKSDKEGWVKFRVEELQHVEDHRTHECKTYKTLLRMRYPDGSIRRILNTKVYYPPKPLLDRYFEIANAEKAKLQHDMKAEGDAIAKKQNRESFNPQKYVEEILLHPDKFIKDWRGHKFCQASVIEEEFKTNHSQAKVIKELAEKKLGLA